MVFNIKQLKHLASFLATTVVVSIFWIVVTNSVGVTNSNIFVGDFETNNFSGWGDQLFCCNYSAQIVSFPKRAGKYAAQFTLDKDDPDVASSKRSELALKPVAANSEQWYGFSIFVPQEYTSDPSYDIIAQWHEVPDDEKTCTKRAGASSALSSRLTVN